MLKDVLRLNALGKVGGGGGVGSWNDLTDKPFGEEVAYILPESELTFEMQEDLGVSVAFVEFASDFVEGETYEVNFDGDVYNCTCFVEEDGSSLLGNIGIFAGEDTGEPFVLGVLEGMPVVIPLVDVQTAVVSVKGKKINTIDPKYVPSLPVIDLISLGCPAATLGQVVNFGWEVSDFNVYRTFGKGSCLIRLKVTGDFGVSIYDENEFIVFASVVGAVTTGGFVVYSTQTIFEGYLIKIVWNPTACVISFATMT